MPEWRSTATIEDLAAWLREGVEAGERIAVLTHTKPDGDAVGSTIGLVRALRIVAERSGRDGSEVRAFYAGATPSWLAQVAFEDEYAGVSALHGFDPARIVVCDTGSWSQLREVAGYLEGRAADIAIVDHHISGDAEIAARIVLETSAAAACQTMIRVTRAMLGSGALAREICEALYLGIGTDTGWFRHSNVDARVLRDAAEMLDAGVDHPALFQLIEQRDAAGRIVLMGRVLSGLELHHDGRLALLRVRLRDVHDVGLEAGQTSGLGDQAMNIASVRVCATLTETGEHPPITKISLRSKEGEGAVDVARVSALFGGGGHARAAGARAPGEIEEVAAALVRAIGEALG